MAGAASQFSRKDDKSTEFFSDKKEKMIAAAIDFGTTFSGYAFITKSQFEKEKTKISLNQNWVAGSMSLISTKAPTAILFNPDGEFDSFGYDAEDTYANLALDKEHEDWYFFKRFKMALHNKKVHRDMEIEDDTRRKKMKAKKVFGESIKYMKNHLMELISTRGAGFVDKDIHWILTVPAIWSDSAKQFMRESAYTADIDGGQLTIALEPEAASLYCQVSHGGDSESGKGKLSLALPGTKYMVIDLGGGTADITVHQRQDDGTLKEMHKATGGAWGGTKVDEEFNQLLIRIIGAPVLTKFCDEHKSDHLDLQREFETKKRTISAKSKGKITMKVPVKIAKIYEQVEKETIQAAIDGSLYAGKITWEEDKMRISADIFKNFFKPCTEKIIAHVKDLMGKPDVQGTNIFLMVGGFSESKIMQSAIEEAFRDVKIIIPEDSGLTVVKGAVVFGHQPVAITSRVSKYTYGINISPPFDPTIHPEDHRVTVGGLDRCRDVFKKYICEGETVRVGEARSGKHVTLKPNQREMLLRVFASPKKDPKFVDEYDTEYLGKVVVSLPDSSEKIKVEVKMMFGETELTVEAVELSQQTKYRAYFDFL